MSKWDTGNGYDDVRTERKFSTCSLFWSDGGLNVSWDISAHSTHKKMKIKCLHVRTDNANTQVQDVEHSLGVNEEVAEKPIKCLK